MVSLLPGKGGQVARETCGCGSRGRTANRPQSSLREIFLTWKPQTASFDKRVEVLDSLCRLQDRDRMEALIVDLLPKSHDHRIQRITWWREIPEIPTITTAEYPMRRRMQLSSAAVNLAGNRAERLVELISHMADFPASGREDVLRALDRFASSPSFTNEKTAVWEQSRDYLHLHRWFPTSEWATPAQNLIATRTFLIAFGPRISYSNSSGSSMIGVRMRSNHR